MKPTTEHLAAAVETAQKQKGLPPVHLWNPPYSGEMDIQVLRDGTWIHEGGKINRPQLVKLFSSILKKEGDRFYLVTPVEKLGITVEDAPFVATDLDISGEGEAQVLTFTTQTEDIATAGPKTPIRVAQSETGEPSPYVMVRAGLEARIDRKSFYRMVELGVHHTVDGQDWFGVWSGGAFFALAASDDIN